MKIENSVVLDIINSAERPLKRQKNRAPNPSLEDNNMQNTSSVSPRPDILAASKLLSSQIEAHNHDPYQRQDTLHCRDKADTCEDYQHDFNNSKS